MKKKRKMKVNFGIFFSLILIVYLFYAIVSQQSVLNKNSKEISDLSDQLTQTQSSLDKAEDSEEIYSSDEFVEKVARDRLGLVRPDETVFVDITAR